MNECMFHTQNRSDVVVPCIVINSGELLNSRWRPPPEWLLYKTSSGSWTGCVCLGKVLILNPILRYDMGKYSEV